VSAEPTLLAIDTATETCSVALLHAGVLSEWIERVGQGHSERVLPMVQALLEETGIELARCDAIAFGAGPGSFTGLRIACGVAQGLAWGIDRRVLPVGNLAGLALAVHDAAPAVARIAAAMDARMNEVYWAVYDVVAVGEGQLRERVTPCRVGDPVAAGQRFGASPGAPGCSRLACRPCAGARPRCAAVRTRPRGPHHRGAAAARGRPGRRLLGWSGLVNAVVRPSEERFVPMTAADLDDVLSVENEVYPFPWTRANFVDSMRAGYCCWTLRDSSGALLSYSVVMLVLDEAHLLNLSVASNAHRLGYGWRMLEFMAQLARDHGARNMMLEVRPSNTPAQPPPRLA